MDDKLLQRYMETFYGYGNYAAPFWFIGMEEGLGNEKEEIVRRLKQWNENGGKELEDLKEFYSAIGRPEFFTLLENRNDIKLQSTWAQLCRIVLTATKQRCDTGAVKCFQKRRLGRISNDVPSRGTCLLELLPLPSPSLGDWNYEKWSKLEILSSRENYKKNLLSIRIAYIQSLINYHKPKVVVFYGVTYQSYWQKISCTPFYYQESNKISTSDNGVPHFFSINHPAAMCSGNAYFENVGELISKVL
ncbi:MAG TPA: hypothetical protein PK613_20455 [Anaerolineaceae bacterium]|nr:hypothetical protein [Anaerolineaceae bacterium]